MKQEFEYQMLDRLRSDCNYFINHCNLEKNLWAGNIKDQIKEMRKIWGSLIVKPSWFSLKEIKNFEIKMNKIKLK